MAGEQSLVVETCDPFQRGEFHRFLGFPWSSSMDQLGFVEAVDGLGERVVIAVALTAYGRFNAGLGQTRSL
jgi:hypothetical protein